MAEDKTDRLSKLVELRNSGVLSEEEFHAARARLLRRQQVTETPAGEASLLSAYWPALVGLAVLVLLVLGVILYGKMAPDEEPADLNIAVYNDMGANVLNAASSGAELCVSDGAYIRIKDLIFDRAQHQFGGAPGPLESLRRSVGVRMQYPLLRGVHQDIGRTDCGGHLVLDLPPAVRGAFDGAPALESDIQYSVQPAADGRGTVIEIAGGDEIVQQLAVAASVVGARRDALGGAPLQKTANPSFDCAGAISNVERMICQDDQLAQLDRALAARYRTLRQDLSPSEWQQVSDSQREFLRRRAICADPDCVHDAYVAQSRYLDRFGPADQGQ